MSLYDAFEEIVRHLDSETIAKIKSGLITEEEQAASCKLQAACIAWRELLAAESVELGTGGAAMHYHV